MTLPSQRALIDACLRGERLYGDDFDASQIAEWFADEAEAYADLGARERTSYHYGYHGLNEVLGFAWLPRDRRFADVLGFGSAYGEELRPLLERIDRLVFVDPSEAFKGDEVGGVPARWIVPDPSGRLPFDDASFDLFTCLGVLHHIPNVSFVVSELARVLRPGGHGLIREPVVSLGDWTRTRRGLTPHERGIPSGILERIVRDAGLRIVSSRPCLSPLARRLWRRLGGGFLPASRRGVRFDAAVSRLIAWSRPYHATRRWQKLGPVSRYIVAARPSQ